MLKSWIENASFYLSASVERLPTDTMFKPMKQTEETAFVSNVMRRAVTCREDEEIKAVAQRIITHSVNHVIVVDYQGKLVGVLTKKCWE